MTVDDSSSVRQLVSMTLRGAGYEVIEAADGQQALERMQASVRMVITDLNMPRMDGVQLIQSIRSHPAYKYVPVIILTTESQEAKRQAGKAAGATGWIVKPFTSAQLLAVAKKVLG
jgi:two-component system chemotaxis response regulator CheY